MGGGGGGGVRGGGGGGVGGRGHLRHPGRTQGTQPQRLLGNEPQNLARATSLSFDVGGSWRRKWSLIGKCHPEVNQPEKRSAERG